MSHVVSKLIGELNERLSAIRTRCWCIGAKVIGISQEGIVTEENSSHRG
jgi:hypothetical protein